MAQATNPRLADWTTDGKLLVSDGEKITRMDADGRNATVLVGDPNAGIWGFSQCGDRYLLLVWAYHAGNTINVWRTNADGSGAKRLSSGHFDASPVCSPDGRWVYFVDQTGTSQVMRVSIEGSQPEPLKSALLANQFGIDNISFISQDSKSIAFVADVVDPNTNEARTKLAIANLENNTGSPPKVIELDPRLGGPQGLGAAVKAMPRQSAVA